MFENKSKEILNYAEIFEVSFYPLVTASCLLDLILTNLVERIKIIFDNIITYKNYCSLVRSKKYRKLYEYSVIEEPV